MPDKHSFLQTAEDAITILRDNTISQAINAAAYRRIIPSKEFYVHQWNWDSCTHAMGLVYLDEDLAMDELRSLISGQWENGLIPQITFNPNEKKYFPGPQFWGTEDFAHGDIMTSGLTQPPLLGVAVATVYRQAKDRKKAEAFLADLLPAVRRYHEYLKTFRDPEDSGLLTIIHPWESGTDNSPRFDQALERISLDEIPESIKAMVRENRTDDKEGDATHRPRLHDYYRYMYLVSLFRSRNWDYEKIVKESPFAMKDILVSSIWCRANREIAALLEDQGERQAAARFRTWAEQSTIALKNTWNTEAQLFTDTDVSLGKNISVLENTIAKFLPLYANAVSPDQARILINKLSDPLEYASTLPVPSTALNNPKFDLARYWRGPTWPITNLFIIDGLEAYPEYKKLQRSLLEKTLSVIAERGFFEYYNPVGEQVHLDEVQETLGFGSFSWTAAIFLYLYNRYLV
jgi:glycogen debranching enzyme